MGLPISVSWELGAAATAHSPLSVLLCSCRPWGLAGGGVMRLDHACLGTSTLQCAGGILLKSWQAQVLELEIPGILPHPPLLSQSAWAQSAGGSLTESWQAQVPEMEILGIPPHLRLLSQSAWSAWPRCAGGILSESWQAQVLELETRLAGSRASWKIVVGHHPVWNNHFNDTEELVASVQPLLER